LRRAVHDARAREILDVHTRESRSIDPGLERAAELTSRPVATKLEEAHYGFLSHRSRYLGSRIHAYAAQF